MRCLLRRGRRFEFHSLGEEAKAAWQGGDSVSRALDQKTPGVAEALPQVFGQGLPCTFSCPPQTPSQELTNMAPRMEKTKALPEMGPEPSSPPARPVPSSTGLQMPLLKMADGPALACPMRWPPPVPAAWLRHTAKVCSTVENVGWLSNSTKTMHYHLKMIYTDHTLT